MHFSKKLEKDKVEALDVGRRVHLGKITPADGFRTVSRLADRHPLCPFFFTNLGVIAITSGEADEDRPGYLALARLKGRHFDPDPLYKKLLEESMMLEVILIDSDIHRNEARQSLYEFYGKGAGKRAGRHLLNHLLLQDLIEFEGGLSAEQAGLYLAKRDVLLPLLLELKSGLEDIISSEGRVPDLTGLFLVLGAYATPEALPLLLRGLEWCTGQALNEAVLALVKTGIHHPLEVTAAVRALLEGERMHEGLIGAVDVLGMLGALEGNYEYLVNRTRELAPRNSIQLEMMAFTADALQRSGKPGLMEESARIAGEDTTALLTRQRKAFIDEAEILRSSRPWELTMTLRREAELKMRERAEALPRLEDYWDYQEGWEIMDEHWCDTELKCDIPRRYRRVLAGLTSFFAITEFGREASLALWGFLCASGRKRLRRDVSDYPLSREEVAFYDWALLSRPLSEQGHSLAQEYLERSKHDELWDDEIDYLQALITSRLSLFEILEAVPDGSLRVHDVFRGDIFPVRNAAGGIDLKPSGAAIMRVGEPRGASEIMGLAFPVSEEVRDGIERAVRSAGASDVPGFLKTHGNLLYFCHTDIFASDPASARA